jgi:GTP pyrophosphokinase
MLERELTRLNVRDVSGDEIAKRLKLNSMDGLCIALGAGDLTTAAIATAIQHLRHEEPKQTLRKRRGPKPLGAASEQIAISGVGDVLCNFARCCRPVPPESISGYITLGRGVSIHRQDCGNFLSLNVRHPERVIEVDWGNAADAIYPAELKLYAYDRQGLLRDISSVLADENVSVDGVQTKTDRKRMQAVMNISIAVPGLPTLSRVIARLEQLPNVTSVQRTI